MLPGADAPVYTLSPPPGARQSTGDVTEFQAQYTRLALRGRRRKPDNAALVSLDLALLLAQQERTEELRSLAVELVAAFEARDIHRESMAALVLFQRACEEGRMTAEMVTHVAALLRGKGEAAATP